MTRPITFEAFAPTITLSRESRTIRGEITEFGVPTTDYRRIVIHEGALRPRLPLSRVKMLIDHDQRQPVGFMTELNGRTAAFSIPAGEAGDKALSDAANGLRDGLSVGINVLDEEGAFTYDADAGTYHVYAAELVEVSLCAIPAYPGAEVTHVAASHHTDPHRKDTTVDPETLTPADLDAALTAQSETFTRTLETRLAAFSPAAPAPVPTWPTFGAFVKDLVGGSEIAMSFYESLAYDGAVSADDRQPNTWVRDAIHLIRRTRKVIAEFTLAPLPDEGMSLEYLQLKSNSISVAKQAAEGDALVKGKVQLKSDTTPVGTYGGWTELSRQVIDRGSAAYVSTANTAMTLEYARGTEEVVRSLLRGIIAAKVGTAKLSIAANANAYAWLDLVVDAAMLFDDLSYSLDGGYVSADVFKKLIRLEDTKGNMLMRVWGTGMNQVGELDLREVTGELASVRFKILPGAPVNTIEFHDRLGITIWESPGAPFRLQDTNTINLTESMSQYGYLAAASQFPDAIQPVKVTGGA